MTPLSQWKITKHLEMMDYEEFYEVFWNDVKIPLQASINDASINEELRTSQKQAVIKLTEKKERDKRFIKNWRSISLLNTNLKMISKVLATGLKDILPHLISSNQTVYVKNRYINEQQILKKFLIWLTILFH